MTEAVADDYRAVAAKARDARDLPEHERRRTIDRLRRDMQRIGQRDFYPPAERRLARQALDELASAMEARSR